MDVPNTANLSPRTRRLLRELTGPETSEQMRLDYDEVAEIVARARVEQSLAVANLIASAIAAVVDWTRRLVGLSAKAA